MKYATMTLYPCLEPLQNNDSQPRSQRPRDIVEIVLRGDLKPESDRSRRTWEGRHRPVPGAHSAVIRDRDDPIRDVAVRPAGVCIGRCDGSADAEQLEFLRVGIGVGGSPAVGEGKAAGLAGVPGREVEREKGVRLVLDALSGVLCGCMLEDG